ncbi:MAG TPA: hypothetical protein DEA96_13920 [Leptospiraceae bacterium]|nr:hypothetical protein [Spirochaetaceae bacterium]HBS06060.1 hypothetical protein [Leptospiraceae bacterium]
MKPFRKSRSSLFHSPMPHKAVLALAILLFTSGSLMAQKRIYRSSQPVGKFIPALIDAMTERGMRFSVEKAYDEKSDGKLGLLITMKPGGRFVDMGFHDENGKSTLVTIRFQDPADSSAFNKLFLQTMNMSEVGVGQVDDSVPSGWPSPGK